MIICIYILTIIRLSTMAVTKVGLSYSHTSTCSHRIVLHRLTTRAEQVLYNVRLLARDAFVRTNRRAIPMMFVRL